MSLPRSFIRASKGTLLRPRPTALQRVAVLNASAPLHTSTTFPPAADESHPSEYHTIGLAIFDGCELFHVPGYGATLSRVVAAGGPGVASWREKSKTPGEGHVAVMGRRKVRLLDRGELFEGGEESGVIRPTAILQLADVSVRDYVADQARRAGIPTDTLHVREQAVSIPAQPTTPSPKGIVHYTVHGPRTLPVDIHTSISASPEQPDKITAEVYIFSGGGKGEYCGSCRTEYALRTSAGSESGGWRAVDARRFLEASNL